jgi:hypothetical protein
MKLLGFVVGLVICVQASAQCGPNGCCPGGACIRYPTPIRSWLFGRSVYVPPTGAPTAPRYAPTQIAPIPHYEFRVIVK